ARPRGERPRAPRTSTVVASTARAVIEDVQPEIDAARFPAKRTVGERVHVEADVFADGHDHVAADVLYRFAGLTRPTGEAGSDDAGWSRVPMAQLGNDRWAADFTVDTLGYYVFTIEAWVDRFATWRDGLSKKYGAGQDVTLELREGLEIGRAHV